MRIAAEAIACLGWHSERCGFGNCWFAPGCLDLITNPNHRGGLSMDYCGEGACAYVILHA